VPPNANPAVWILITAFYSRGVLTGQHRRRAAATALSTCIAAVCFVVECRHQLLLLLLLGERVSRRTSIEHHRNTVALITYSCTVRPPLLLAGRRCFAELFQRQWTPTIKHDISAWHARDRCDVTNYVCVRDTSLALLTDDLTWTQRSVELACKA